MKLNHLNLTVRNASETRKFLEKYFGLQGEVNPYTGEPTGAEGQPELRHPLRRQRARVNAHS